MKREIKGALIGGIVGLLLSIIKYFVGGFTWFDYSESFALFNLFFLTISFCILGYISLKINLKKFLNLFLLTVTILLLIFIKIVFALGNLNSSSLFILGGLCIAIILIDLIALLVSFVISKLFNIKKSVVKLLAMINLWFFFVIVTIEDMIQHFNPGGASGKWYIYGDYLFLFGVLIIFIWNYLKNEK